MLLMSLSMKCWSQRVSFILSLSLASSSVSDATRSIGTSFPLQVRLRMLRDVSIVGTVLATLSSVYGAVRTVS